MIRFINMCAKIKTFNFWLSNLINDSELFGIDMSISAITYTTMPERSIDNRTVTMRVGIDNKPIVGRPYNRKYDWCFKYVPYHNSLEYYQYQEFQGFVQFAEHFKNDLFVILAHSRMNSPSEQLGYHKLIAVFSRTDVNYVIFTDPYSANSFFKQKIVEHLETKNSAKEEGEVGLF